MSSLIHLAKVTTLSLLLTTSAYAAYSDNYTQCMNNSNGVTADMLDCISAEHKYQDSLLNKYYKQIIKNLEAPQQKLFKKSQIAWIKWREAEAKFAGSSGGSFAQVSSAGVFLEITVNRVDSFANMLGINVDNASSGISSQSSFAGTYKLQEEGRSGEFTLTSEGQNYLIELGSATNEGDTCDFSGTCQIADQGLTCIANSDFLSPNDDINDYSLSISFKDNVAIIDTMNSSIFCGMRNYLNGNYYKK